MFKDGVFNHNPCPSNTCGIEDCCGKIPSARPPCPQTDGGLLTQIQMENILRSPRSDRMLLFHVPQVWTAWIFTNRKSRSQSRQAVAAGVSIVMFSFARTQESAPPPCGRKHPGCSLHCPRAHRLQSPVTAESLKDSMKSCCCSFSSARVVCPYLVCPRVEPLVLWYASLTVTSARCADLLCPAPPQLRCATTRFAGTTRA